ncbi:MAG: T9SS type A sorting domain-containing protein [Bacteroidia bacterium]|nr:T9SS type A sorting domain-containing protein [Bacteroidia bacterium]
MLKKLLLFLLIAGLRNSYSQSNFQITFNAGTGVLAGVSPVYIYAGVGIDQPGNFWQYAVGNITNPGVGLMTNVGPNLWSICFEPYAYFSQGPAGAIPGGSVIYNLSMIFHNVDFSVQVNTDPNNFPINIAMTSVPPASSWVLVSGVFQNCTLDLNDFQITNGVLSNYPNPAKTNTVFIYTLKNSGQIKINVFNSLGKKVHEVANEFKSPGTHSFEWDLKNIAGERLRDGMYFYNVELNGKVLQTNKLIISGY